jgi:hypothetical protein
LIDPIELACWSDAGPASLPPACTETSYYGLRFTQEPTSLGDYQGPAVVEDTSPLRLRTPEGALIRTSLSSLAVPAEVLGQTIVVNLELECTPFWCDSRLVLSRPGGTWFYAAWDGRRDLLPNLPGLQLSAEVSACRPRGSDCFNRVAFDLVATSSVGERQLSLGQQVVLGGLTIAHAYGEASFEVTCTDYRGEALVGAVRRD